MSCRPCDSVDETAYLAFCASATDTFSPSTWVTAPLMLDVYALMIRLSLNVVTSVTYRSKLCAPSRLASSKPRVSMLNVIYVFPAMRAEAGIFCLYMLKMQRLLTVHPALGEETLDGATAGWMHMTKRWMKLPTGQQHSFHRGLRGAKI